MSEQAVKRHIHVDIVGGLAGDIFAAAAIDAGLIKAEKLEEELRKVGLGPVQVITKRVVRGAIEGTHLSYAGWDAVHDADHRHLTTIREMIRKSSLTEGVKGRAIEMFEVLGKAEAEVHGMELEDVHFHEVGAVDSILDFVAAAWIIEEAKATWSVGQIPMGKGMIETAHGTIPVPAPATARVLEGMEVVARDVEAELVTPTGATIAAVVAGMPGVRAGRLGKSGFGCGTRQIKGISNVARLMVFEEAGDAQGAVLEELVELSCEIDDQSPELLAQAADQLLEAGALDVVRRAVQMKKGRLATGLYVLCRPEDEQELLALIFSETTTFGVRRNLVERWALWRAVRQVETEYGSVGVKVGFWGDQVVQASPEFEDCRRLAKAQGVSARAVFEAARRGAQDVLTAQERVNRES